MPREQLGWNVFQNFRDAVNLLRLPSSQSKDVIVERTASVGKERIFDDMNNGFGWSRLPKSFMAENTVFLQQRFPFFCHIRLEELVLPRKCYQHIDFLNLQVC